MKKVCFLSKIFIFLFISFIICLVSLYTYAYFSPKLELKNVGQMYVYDNKEKLVYQGSGTVEWVSIDNISPYLLNAVISVEDKNFYKHQGFDYLRIMKAMLNNIKSKSIVEGASTISQQYIKNMYLKFDKTWKRKLDEAFLTLELEVHYDKNEILEGYLNTINFGGGNYGIMDASHYYFNKEPKDLTLEEAIMLAGIPKNPTKYNPATNYENAKNRALVVAKTMVKNKVISEDVFNNLFQNPLEIYGKKDNEDNLKMIMYYQDAVMDELYKLKGIPKTLLDSGSLKIYTTLDYDAQKKLEEEIVNTIDDEKLQVASVLIDPKSGGVLALTGGKNYNDSQFNRALKSKRQVGSTMKPFLYYAALENGLRSSTTFNSEPTNFMFANNQVYSPKNYNNIYANEEITMAAALAYSDNIYAVKTHLFLGEDTLVNMAKTIGIKENLDANPSLALGTSELNMLDFAHGYTTLASEGERKDNYFIEKVEDLDGNILYKHKDNKKQVLNANYVYILNEMLSNTSNANFIGYTSPTALSISSKMSRKYALKTGTTNTDYWTVGFNKDALLMVWTGYDDSSPIPDKVSSYGKNIWINTIEDFLKDKDEDWYSKPDNVVGVLLDPITGEENSKKPSVFYFEKGSENSYDSVTVSKEEEN